MKIKLMLLLLLMVNGIFAQDTIMPLWPKDKIPNHVKSSEREIHEQNEILRISKVQVPTIEVYLPSKRDATGEAVLIFPGGGYGILAYDWEGTDIAKFLNSKGIAGIVLKYRLPSDVSQTDKKFVPLIDAQRAVKLVRSKAEQFNVKTNKIGIIGFSAGGHLASTLGTHFDEKVYKDVDDIDEESARPDFMALGYPVISFGPHTHSGSKTNLIGEEAPSELSDYFSNEKQVTKLTPPTFLLHATDDTVVPVENSLLFYKAVKNKGVSATMHIYPKGGHGFGLGLHDEHLKDWGEGMIDWIISLR
ncbi:acetyl esterase/lipase [Maribacter caenipelagi]|uniref:Acetyl esterase/lipase n=1 Tax=Maribacter caenipelagi TaxID=1447781 RepID=A0A4R7D020_9FLAO|nr:alpha/beta hydrolase [Maribacter caenipelagi]TDS14239.1 acetyl esterase/lipase [Maribacter caenipelagi]